MTPTLRQFATSASAAKRIEVVSRIKRFEEAIAKGREYLETGEHADWHGFRPLFVRKMRNGKPLPPHRDWVKNVYLPRLEQAVRRAERILDRLD